ncbi:MAG: hypothetical protein Q8941_03075 [Bacteroidota bacterium]|nr:hypothetical protein [Bacteroidota bacterium]
MEKYLFRDGTNVTREVESRKELQSLIQSCPDTGKIRIWLFNTSEWITLADFNKRFTVIPPSNGNVPAIVQTKAEPKISKTFPNRSLLKKIIIAALAAAVIFLVYNFTKLTWAKASPSTILAARPANTPPVNADSLIATVESLRGQKLDKVTRTNLRIRNTWPDLVILKLNTDRDTSREGSRFYNLELVIDNATGYRIDEALVELNTWKNGMAAAQSFQFMNIGYASPAKKKIEGTFRGDSITVSFSSIKAKAFNFCYSSDKKSNYGNYNDRWYCRE